MRLSSCGLGSIFGRLGGSWGVLGRVLGTLGGLLGHLGGILGSSWRPLGASWRPLGELLEASRVPLDLSGEPLGPSRVRFESSWGPLGRLLKGLEDRLAMSSKTFIFFRWISLIFQVSGGALERLERLSEALGALLEPSWELFGPTWSS